MTINLVIELTILVLAIFVGFEVISKVPAMLHTPLMSGTNAIHGIVLIGAMLIVVGGILLHQLQVADDDREEVVEVVGDTAGELADGFQLLGVA